MLVQPDDGALMDRFADSAAFVLERRIRNAIRAESASAQAAEQKKAS